MDSYVKSDNALTIIEHIQAHIQPDFLTVSGCDQLVVGPTHARGGTRDLLLTDVPDLVRVSVEAPIGNSDR